MNQKSSRQHRNLSGETLTTEFLILPDGRILVHNLTAVFADMLAEVNHDSDEISPRTTHHTLRLTTT